MNLGVVGLFVLQAAAVTPSAPITSGSDMASPVVRIAIQAEREFFALWLRQWRGSEAARHPTSWDNHGTITGAVSTHPGRMPGAPFRPSSYACFDFQTLPVGRRAAGLGISSRFTILAVCPNWFLDTGDPSFDERLRLDDALTPRYRGAVVEGRRVLLALLDSLAATEPRNGFVVGQRVRLALDQGRADEALDIAGQCRAESAWCSALLGYVLAARGQTASADSAFGAAAAAMTQPARCRWTDVATLLDSAARRVYVRIPCAQRDSANAHIWWLAQPLYIESGNSRRVEDFVRKVTIALHSEPGSDERYNWAPKAGGDARAEMLTRFGWPTYTYWGGTSADSDNADKLLEFHSAPSPPYTTYEYARGRIHLVPTSHAIAEPFDAQVGDWTLHAPEHQDEPSLVGAPLWWPREHSALTYQLVQLPDEQTAQLRRQSSILLAVAAALPTQILRRDLNESIDGITLVTSRAPGDAVFAPEVRASAGSTVVARQNVNFASALVSLEIPSGPGRPAARTRFGVRLPTPLSMLPAAGVAISDPVIIRPPVGDERPPSNPDSALAQMVARTSVSAGGRLGVYWETYGFSASDTVQFAVWIERYSAQSTWRRLGTTLGIARDLNTPVVTTWTESGLSANTYLIRDTVPIVGRSMVLDVWQLPKGQYWIEVAASRRGAEPVRARRSFTVD